MWKPKNLMAVFNFCMVFNVFKNLASWVNHTVVLAVKTIELNLHSKAFPVASRSLSILYCDWMLYIVTSAHVIISVILLMNIQLFMRP